MSGPTVLYFVLVDLGPRGLVWAERDPSRMSREQTLADMCAGQFDIVRQVIEVEFTDTGISSRDVSEEMILARCRHSMDQPPDIDPAWRRYFNLDHAQDERKNWSE